MGEKAIRYHQHENTAQELPRQADTTNLLRLPRARRNRFAFTLVHYPSGWMHVQGYGWTPRLIRATHTPAVNGVKVDPRTQQPNARAMLGVHAENGALVLHRNRFRVDGKDYVVRHACVDGGWHYTDRFVNFVTIAGETAPTKDLDGWRDWKASLIAEGWIDAMPREVLTSKLKLVAARVTRLERDPRIGSAYVQRGLSELEQLRADMTADWERQFAEPKKQRKTRSDAGHPRKPKQEVLSP